MEDLIKALQIFIKYQNLQWPTICEHDILYIVGITEDEVLEDDKNKLNIMGFHYEDGSWVSHKYGSA